MNEPRFLSCMQMNFPVTDVVKNIRYFLQVVKEATGNVRSRKGNDEKNPKPGTLCFLLGCDIH